MSDESKKPSNAQIINAIIAAVATISAAIIGATAVLKAASINNPPTPAITSSPFPTFTSIPTFTLTPFICPYQGATDDETIKALIMAEAVAAREKNMKIIDEIFSFDATFYDYATNPPKISVGVEARYANDLFVWVNFKYAEHFAVLPAGAGISGDAATYTSGSQITYQVNGGPLIEQTNEAGSEHWTLKKNENGCWIIAQMEFNAGHKKFPP